MLTGATGAMGFETLKEFSTRLDRFDLRLIVRPSKKNKRKLADFLKLEGVTVIWGDLMNPGDVREALKGADYAIHMGGMVSPLADHFPEKTLKVNVGAMQNIIDAVKESGVSDKIKVVYIGSVAQTSNHNPPYHWGRTGDPILPAKFDYYGLSKIKAERLIAESGLRYWVSLRQTGILHKGLVNKATDPISFHVPLKGVLEWATVEDSARLMANICEDGVPEDFWRSFYNIGSGEQFRLTNYEFEKKLMAALGCPPPEKVFERNWFATRNFHGQWYEDSDLLENLVPFRENITADAYFSRLASRMPWWTRLAPLAPAFIIKAFMKTVARTKHLGTLYWKDRTDYEDRINAFFGNREKWNTIEKWDTFDSSRPSEVPVRLSHGYDESKAESELDIRDMNEAAEFRGGKCLSETMDKGDLHSRLEWECAEGHKFESAPLTILKGGHWCPECLTAYRNYENQARKNKFLAQLLSDFIE